MTSRLVPLGVCVATAVFALVRGPSGDELSLVKLIDEISGALRSDGLFIHAGGETWYQPLAVYPAAWLSVAGMPRDVAIVMPSLLAACVVVWLTYALSARTHGSPTYASVSAALLLMTPGFLLHARTAGGNVLMVAAILGWYVIALEHAAHPRQWLLGAGGLVLALAAYAQPAGVLAVPVFFLIGAVGLRRAGLQWRYLLLPLAGIFVALLPMAMWVIWHPEAYPDTLGRWAIHAAHVRDPIDGLVAFTRWHVAARRVSDYWDYFSPSFLFGSGQLFALWAVVVIPLGLWVSRSRTMSPAVWMTVVGLLATPLPAVLLDVTRAAGFVLLLIPLGVVLAPCAIALVNSRALGDQGGHGVARFSANSR